MWHWSGRDLRFAFRQFAGRPGFTLTVVLVLALGLGANTAIFGVMPRGSLFPNDRVEAWSPLLNFLPPAVQIRHDLHFLAVIARLRKGVPMDRARAELDGLAHRYKQEHPDVATGSGAIVIPLHEALVRNVYTSLVILLGAVGCVLLIACVNVANLLLTRSSARAREFYVRAAMGACRILKTLLFGIGPLDPLTFCLVPPLLAAVSSLACYIPTIRATRIDPTVALRSE